MTRVETAGGRSKGIMRKLFGWYQLPLKIMVKPFSGFYEMKFERKGTMWLAFVNLFLVCFAMAFSNQYTGIIIDQSHPLTVNSLTDVLFVLGTLILFCAGNWSVSCLTDGEGKFKDILMAVCYAMTPLIITIIPATILSNVLVAEETGIYYILMTLGTAYFVGLVFVGLITVHNYGAVKALINVLLTFAALLVIVFLITLLFTLWQQLWAFAYSLYTELTFRTW